MNKDIMKKLLLVPFVVLLCFACVKYFNPPALPSEEGRVATARITWAVGGLDLDWSRIKIFGVLDGKDIAVATREDDKLFLAFSFPRERQPKDVVVRLVKDGQTIFEKPYDSIDNVAMRTALMMPRVE